MRCVQQDFQLREVEGCRRCSRMAESRGPKTGPRNGPLDARVVFVAEAPGRLGADRYGLPLHGDVAGRNFERLLAAAAWTGSDVFITNAVLCNPRDARGNNAPPTMDEIRNCSGHLQRVLDLVKPVVLVALGAKALKALAVIEPRRATLADAGKVFRWRGTCLVPLYHPGARAMIRRPFPVQAEDCRRLRTVVVDGFCGEGGG